MELLIVIMAAVLVWVVGAIWYRLADGVYADASALQVRNIGHPQSKSVVPYLLAGVGLVAVAAMIRILFVHAGIDGVLTGVAWGASIGAFIVAPWFMIENTYSARPMVMVLIDMGYAIVACAVLGAVMGGV